MYPSLLGDANLYAMLLKADEELAAEARARGCSCGGALHSARYPRKPRGALVELPVGYVRRESLCCAEDGCRRRTTPPSLRFLGRKVYLGVIVALMTAMRHGVTASRAAALRRAVGVSRKTLLRWRAWWTTRFNATVFWASARAELMPSVPERDLPASLLIRFEGAGTSTGLVRFLDFIKPVTTSPGRESISMVE